MPLTGDCEPTLRIQLPASSSMLDQNCTLQEETMAPMRRNLNAESVNPLLEEAELEIIEEEEGLDELDNCEDIREVFTQYRLECEQLVQSSATLNKEVGTHFSLAWVWVINECYRSTFLRWRALSGTCLTRTSVW